MTFAWYGHLKFTDRSLWLVVVGGIAFLEYCFVVPANRWSSAIYSAALLKTRGDHALGVRGLLGLISRRADHANSRGWLRPDLHRCVLVFKGPLPS
jgi:hypothetical protein